MKTLCEAVQEQLEAYALGVLDAAEEAQVTQHVEGCSDCGALLADYQAVVGELPQLLLEKMPQWPPSALKERLWQQIEAEAGAASTMVRVGKRRPFWATYHPSTVWARPAFALAALVLLISFAWLIARQGSPEPSFVQSDLEAIDQQQALIKEIVESDETIEAALAPQQAGSYAWGHLYRHPDRTTAVLTASHLPSPPYGQHYFVWYGTADHMLLAGTMNVNEEGFGLLLFQSEVGAEIDVAQIALQPVDDMTEGELVLRWTRE